MTHLRYKIPDALAVLPSGLLLVVGGAPQVEALRAGASAFTTVDGELGATRSFSLATLLADGRLLISGGYDDAIRPTPTTWIWSP
jgi:hypothetical protein